MTHILIKIFFVIIKIKHIYAERSCCDLDLDLQGSDPNVEKYRYPAKPCIPAGERQAGEVRLITDLVM